MLMMAHQMQPAIILTYQSNITWLQFSQRQYQAQKISMGNLCSLCRSRAPSAVYEPEYSQASRMPAFVVSTNKVVSNFSEILSRALPQELRERGTILFRKIIRVQRSSISPQSTEGQLTSTFKSVSAILTREDTANWSQLKKMAEVSRINIQVSDQIFPSVIVRNDDFPSQIPGGDVKRSVNDFWDTVTNERQWQNKVHLQFTIPAYDLLRSIIE